MQIVAGTRSDSPVRFQGERKKAARSGEQLHDGRVNSHPAGDRGRGVDRLDDAFIAQATARIQVKALKDLDDRRRPTADRSKRR